MKIEKLNNNSYRLRKMYKGQIYTVILPYKPTEKEALIIMAEQLKSPKVAQNTAQNTVSDIFKNALADKKRIRSANTTYKLQADFDRFINREFQSMRIEDVTSEYLKNYTLNVVFDKPIRKKAFLGYKTMLNLIFEYAVDKSFINENIAKKMVNSDYIRLCVQDNHTAEAKCMAPEQIKTLVEDVRAKMLVKGGKNHITGYMLIMATYTGMRVGELCALKWDDISDKAIHIHAQQLRNLEKNKLEYVEWTKDEKGFSKGGRYFPLTDNVKELLEELKQMYQSRNISSEWVFATDHGSWVTANSYISYLIKLSKKHGYEITNNHAIRMYFNSYVLIPAGVSVTNRAKLLGHSVEVNLKNYSFEEYSYTDITLTQINQKKL